jgi:secondary thiamine-phosphate synthase enzyme
METTSFDVSTRGREQMLDITSRVAQAVEDSQIGAGTVTVYVPHTTAGVTVNENADPDVVRDMLSALEHAVPWRQSFYRHGEGNSAAHVKSSLVGCSAVLPVVGGRMALGTWQAIFFCEFDGPRTRKVVVTVIGR